MPDRNPITDLGTHEVINQPPPLGGHNLYETDPALKEAVHREGAGAFCASRLAGDWGRSYGTLSPHTDFDAIIDRARIESG